MKALEYGRARVILTWKPNEDELGVVNLLDDPESPGECSEYGTLGALLNGLGITLDSERKLQQAEAERDRLFKLQSLCADLLEQAAVDIDAMFPNDEHPEMQDDLRRLAGRLRAALAGEST